MITRIKPCQQWLMKLCFLCLALYASNSLATDSSTLKLKNVQVIQVAYQPYVALLFNQPIPDTTQLYLDGVRHAFTYVTTDHQLIKAALASLERPQIAELKNSTDSIHIALGEHRSERSLEGRP